MPSGKPVGEAEVVGEAMTNGLAVERIVKFDSEGTDRQYGVQRS